MSRPSFRVLIDRTDKLTPNPTILKVGFRGLRDGVPVWLSHDQLKEQGTVKAALSDDEEDNFARALSAIYELHKGGKDFLNKGHFMKEAIVAGMDPLAAWDLYQARRSELKQVFAAIQEDLVNPHQWVDLDHSIPQQQRSYPAADGKSELEKLRSRINKSGQKTGNLKKGTRGFRVGNERVNHDGTVEKFGSKSKGKSSAAK
jgi:hypothetical protein